MGRLTTFEDDHRTSASLDAGDGCLRRSILAPSMGPGCMVDGDAVSPTWTFVGGLAKRDRRVVLSHVGQEGMLLFWTWRMGPA